MVQTAVLVNLSARNLQKEVKYNNPTSKIVMNNQDDNEDQFFFNQKLLKEVMATSEKNKKKFLKVCLTTIASSISLLTLVSPTLAQVVASVEVTNELTQTQPNKIIMPKDLLEVGAWLIGILAVANFLLAVITSQLASGWRTLRGGTKASAWTIEIFKGFVQSLLMPVIIATIALIAGLLFSGFEWFISPF